MLNPAQTDTSDKGTATINGTGQSLSSNTWFYASSDGYIKIVLTNGSEMDIQARGSSSQTGYMRIWDIKNNTGTTLTTSLFVRKNMGIEAIIPTGCSLSFHALTDVT